MTHHHHDHHPIGSNLSFEEKLIKLLEHWIRHNDEHARNYNEWGIKANENNLKKVGSYLENAAKLMTQADREFKEALDYMTAHRYSHRPQ